MKAPLKILALAFVLAAVCYGLRCLIIAVLYRQMQEAALKLGEDAPAYSREWGVYFAIISDRARSAVNWVIAGWCLGLLHPAVRERLTLYSAALGVLCLGAVGLDEKWRWPALLTTVLVSLILPPLAFFLTRQLKLDEEAT